MRVSRCDDGIGCTLLEVCPSTASDKQGISGESQALVTQHQGDAAIRVAWRLPNRQHLHGPTRLLGETRHPPN